MESRANFSTFLFVTVAVASSSLYQSSSDDESAFFAGLLGGSFVGALLVSGCFVSSSEYQLSSSSSDSWVFGDFVSVTPDAAFLRSEIVRTVPVSEVMFDLLF